AEDGIRDFHVTGVQTCALPILMLEAVSLRRPGLDLAVGGETTYTVLRGDAAVDVAVTPRRWDAAGIALATWRAVSDAPMGGVYQIGRASCRGRASGTVGGGARG